MDKNALVESGSKLVKWLDESSLKPRAAMWVYNTEADTWRLWIVPASGLNDKREFYLALSDIIAAHRDEIPGFDISSVEFKAETHPAVQGLKKMFRMEGLGSAHLSNNSFNGFLLPDGIVLRMAV
ncbi:MAG: hypothetical protein ACK519_02885 [Sphingomonadaceae bacterium]